jgi:RNA polymerase sigma-70 factor (ECF subfamily)
VAQEAFLKAYKGIANFRGGASFRTWLLTITLNTARSLRTRSKAKKRSAPELRLDAQGRWPNGNSEERQMEVPDPEARTRPSVLLERKEVKEALEMAIADLDESARQVIVLRDIAGESYEAIAASLGLPTGTVKSRVHRARLDLQARMAHWL